MDADGPPSDADIEALLAGNPFPGLRSFTTDESDQFFGRRQQIDELIQRLTSVPLLAVAGESGCGKSSLVLAGLLSGLAREEAAGGGVQWIPVVMRPGGQPVASLARALASVLPLGGGTDADLATRAASLDGSLRLGSLGLVEIVRRARLQPHQRLLVVVDQFEETFRFQRSGEPGEAVAFIKLLLTAANDPEVQLSTVLTLRSNALGRCADFRGLPEAVNRGQYLVPKLTREQRKQAIVAPVEVAGYSIAPRLVQRLLNDVSDDFDDLPVMQHALSRTWQQWARSSGGKRAIDLEDYEAIGSSTEALSRHADEAGASLDKWQPWVERVFRALTELTPEGSTNRRPLHFSMLQQVVQAPEGAVAAVVERFRRPDTALLMPPVGEPLVKDPVIDISHESLIRLWPSLGRWAQAEAGSRAQALALVKDAQDWAHQDAELLRGSDLKRALAWQQREKPNAAWLALCTGQDGAARLKEVEGYLSASAAEADASAAAKRSDRSRRRSLMLALCGLAVLVVIGSVMAAFKADKLQRQARASELASLAMLRINQDPAYSAHLAAAALDQDASNAKAEFALRQSWASLETAHAVRIVDVGQGEPVIDMRYTSDKQRVLVTTRHNMQLLDTSNLQSVPGALKVKSDLWAAWPVDQGQLVLAQFANGQAQLLAMDGQVVQELVCPDARPAGEYVNHILKVVASPDGGEVAIGCYDGAVVRWPVDDGRVGPPRKWQRDKPGPVSTSALVYSPDSRYIASGDMNGIVRIWQRGKDKPLIGGGNKTAPSHTEAVTDIVFKDGDSSLLATGSDDLKASVWRLDFERGRLAEGKSEWSFTHERPVKLIRFVQQGKDISLMTVADTRVYFWGESGEIGTARKQADWIADAQASDDGAFVVSASNDGTARLWSTANAVQVAMLAGHSDGVMRALFVPGQAQVITAGDDGTVRLWNLNPPHLLLSSKKWLLSASVAPDGQLLAACGERGSSLGAHCSLTPLDKTRSHVAGGAELVRMRAGPEQGAFAAVALSSWSADGRWLLGSAMKHDIRQQFRCKVWKRDGTEVSLPKVLKGCRLAAFSTKSNWLLTSDETGGMALWDTATLDKPEAEPRRVWPPGSTWDLSAISADGRWVAAVEGNDALLWDLQQAEGKPRRLGSAHHGKIKRLRFSDDNRLLVTAATDRTARVWPLQPARGMPESVELAGGHTAALAYASFSPDNQRVVTSSADGTIRIWDATSGRELTVLRWHGAAVNEARFTADGQSIISASDDGTIKLGTCEACSMKLEAMREKLVQMPLSKQDERRLLAETAQPTSYLRWLGVGSPARASGAK